VSPRAALVAALLVLGCRTVTATPVPRASAPTLELPLTFDAEGVPMVEVMVEGHAEAVRLDPHAAGNGPAATLGTLAVTLSSAHALAPQRLASRGAVVLDFPKARLVLLDGGLATWLRWLDGRAPRAQVESMPRLPGEGLAVSVFIGATVAAQLDPAHARSSLGVDHVMLGTTVVPATMAAATAPPVVGMDVLRGVVLVIPAGSAPLLLSFGAP
jgi:hypothetical protein